MKFWCLDCSYSFNVKTVGHNKRHQEYYIFLKGVFYFLWMKLFLFESFIKISLKIWKILFFSIKYESPHLLLNHIFYRLHQQHKLIVFFLETKFQLCLISLIINHKYYYLTDINKFICFRKLIFVIYLYWYQTIYITLVTSAQNII